MNDVSVFRDIGRPLHNIVSLRFAAQLRDPAAIRALSLQLDCFGSRYPLSYISTPAQVSSLLLRRPAGFRAYLELNGGKLDSGSIVMSVDSVFRKAITSYADAHEGIPDHFSSADGEVQVTGTDVLFIPTEATSSSSSSSTSSSSSSLPLHALRSSASVSTSATTSHRNTFISSSMTSTSSSSEYDKSMLTGLGLSRRRKDYDEEHKIPPPNVRSTSFPASPSSSLKITGMAPSYSESVITTETKHGSDLSSHFDVVAQSLSRTMGLPAWAYGDYDSFLNVHRAALESPQVSYRLHRWIDLVFGHNQRGTFYS